MQDKNVISTSSELTFILFLLAERAFEVSPDQGVKGEVPVLPEEEQLGGEDEELVADVKIGNLLLGLVEII